MTTKCKKCGKEYRLYLDALECCKDEKKKEESLKCFNENLKGGNEKK